MTEIDTTPQMREDLDVLAQQFEAAQARTKPTTGRDESRMVEVDMAVDGRLSKVTVDPSWQTRLGPADLAGAVLAAITEASVQRLGDFATHLGEELDTPRSPRPLMRTDDDFMPRLLAAAGDGVDEVLVREVLGRLAAAVDEAITRVDELSQTTYTGRSTSGHVRASVRIGGDVQSVDFDLDWLDHAHTFNIGRETLEAIAAAGQTAATTGLQVVSAQGKLAELQMLLADPEALGAAIRARRI